MCFFPHIGGHFLYKDIYYYLWILEHAEYIDPSDTLLLEWAGVPEHPEDEPAPAVAASEPMNAEEDEAPTPADGVQGAAYGDGEKSPNFDDFEERSNLLVHHQRMKGEHPDAVLLYRMGNFYEAYFQDSQTVADCLGSISFTEFVCTLSTATHNDYRIVCIKFLEVLMNF